MAEVIEPAPTCSRCGSDDEPMVVNDRGESLCLGCAEALGEQSGVEVEAVALLRLLASAKPEPTS